MDVWKNSPKKPQVSKFWHLPDIHLPCCIFPPPEAPSGGRHPHLLEEAASTAPSPFLQRSWWFSSYFLLLLPSFPSSSLLPQECSGAGRSWWSRVGPISGEHLSLTLLYSTLLYSTPEFLNVTVSPRRRLTSQKIAELAQNLDMCTPKLEKKRICTIFTCFFCIF